MIPITKPFMPPQEEYELYLRGIWEREYLTNNGPLVQELEARLENYLGTEYLLFVANGTIALQIAIKVLGLKGEIITTPFSYVATTSSIVWEGCKPVFTDIDPQTLNIDAGKIENAITDKTTAILATHVYGNPCDIDALHEIAEHYDLKVIYDASHCFGTEYNGQSILNYGDISTVSFHATKLYHTVEGGGIITQNPEIRENVSRMRNFGHAGPGNFEGIGINGKNSELHAAMGLCNLKYINEVLGKRKQQWLKYSNSFDYINVQSIDIHPKAGYNYAYFPIIFDTEETLLNVKQHLENNQIYPRRYFYPGLYELDYVDATSFDVDMTNDISKRILCLPLFHDMIEEEQDRVISVIRENVKQVVYE